LVYLIDSVDSGKVYSGRCQHLNRFVTKNAKSSGATTLETMAADINALLDP
jgi:hypothetical protein